MDDFRAILRDNALGATPDVDKAHSTFVGLRDFDKQGLNIILHVRPRLCPPPPSLPFLTLPCICQGVQQAAQHKVAACCTADHHAMDAGALLIG